MRIAIVDDDVAFRRGLSTRVGTSLAASVDGLGLQTFAEAPDTEPYDLLIIDPFGHPSVDAAGVLARAQAQASHVVVMTGHDGVEELTDVIGHRIDGYLLKTDTDVALDAAIADLLTQGRPAVSGQLAPKLFNMLAGRGAPGRTDKLTSREVEVLHWVARGSSNRDIAMRLGIAENTVKNHLRHILDKLHVRSRLGAVLVAVRAGVIDVHSID